MSTATTNDVQPNRLIGPLPLSSISVRKKALPPGPHRPIRGAPTAFDDYASQQAGRQHSMKMRTGTAGLIPTYPHRKTSRPGLTAGAAPCCVGGRCCARSTTRSSPLPPTAPNVTTTRLPRAPRSPSHANLVPNRIDGVHGLVAKAMSLALYPHVGSTHVFSPRVLPGVQEIEFLE